jgi:hypothetical protein
MSNHDRISLLAASDINANDVFNHEKVTYSENRSSFIMRESQVYEPDPLDASTRKSVLKTVAGYILITEFCERLAYYGFAGSLVLFFQVKFKCRFTVGNE